VAFARDAGRAFLSTRASRVAIAFACLPFGAYALGLAMQSNLAVELGLGDTQIGLLSLCTSVISAVCCMLGGWLSDRYGRRRTLALFIAGTTLPAFAMAVAMHRFGWILPVDPTVPGRVMPPAELVSVFWALVLSYGVFQGLMYGVGTAIFMDVTVPRVAATQFTAYMALTNFATSYSAQWQGHAVQRWGYPATLALDGAFGLVCLVLLPWMGAARRAGRP